MSRYKIFIIILTVLACLSLGLFTAEKINKKTNTADNVIQTYNMTQNEIESLPTNTIENKSVEDEKSLESENVETETFEEQGDIAYESASQYPSVSLGNYVGLTYYSQLDSRWGSNFYTSTGNSSQTIASSGCGPTSAAMVVTATKGAITPDTMSKLFVSYGYRSANNGTYWSAYSWVADTFDIDYNQTTSFSSADDYFNNHYYIIVACGQGLFTTRWTLYCYYRL